MPSKRQIKLAELKVGIFVTVALLLLAALILQQSWGVNWFSKSAKAMTYLSDVGGLKPGAPVWLAGIEIGKVRKVGIVEPTVYAGNEPLLRQIEALKRQLESIDRTLPTAQKEIEELRDRIESLKADVRIVEVRLDIRPQYLNQISRDSEVSIESRGLIGDSFIDITPGVLGSRPDLIGDSYLIKSTQHPGFREIMTGANDVVANFGVLTDQFKNMVKKINPEKTGTSISATIKDVQHAVFQANNTFGRATALLDDLHSGKGTFGRIVSDPTLYQRLTEALEKFNSLFESIQNGKGTAAKLINDPSLFNAANETLKKAERVMDRIEKGEGTLGKLTKDEALYDKTKNALDRFASLANSIEQGNGTIGKLLKDPSLYNNLDQSSSELSKFIFDLRKDPKKYLTIHFRVF
jgi:phospholipid/cholesterol/gamma-HCH transport system substrate-binding protein